MLQFSRFVATRFLLAIVTLLLVTFIVYRLPNCSFNDLPNSMIPPCRYD